MQNSNQLKIELIKKILTLSAEDRKAVTQKAAEIINRRPSSEDKKGDIRK